MLKRLYPIAIASLFIFSMLVVALPQGALADSSDSAYIIYQSSGIYYAQNTTTLAIDFSGTNAATVINNAIGALTPGRTWEEEVYLSGDILITAAISPASYTRIEASGTVFLDYNANCHMIAATSKNHITIMGGNWDGEQDHQSSGGTATRGFDFTSCSNITISGLHLYSIAYDNIAFTSSSYITISNVHVYDCGDYARGSAWLGHGMGMYYSSHCTIDNCQVDDAASGGIYFYCEDDSVVQHIDHNVISNCTVQRTRTTGISISLRGSEDIGHGNLIENNTCINTGNDGVHPGINLGFSATLASTIRWADNCTVQYNTIYSTGTPYDSGEGIDFHANYSTCRYNTVHDMKDGGIVVMGDHNLISHNQLSDTTSAGRTGILMCDADNNEVSNNTISNTASYGIWLVTYGLSSGCSYNSIVNNSITNPGASYAWLAITNGGSTANIIEYNAFVNAADISHAVDDGGTGTIINYNTFVAGLAFTSTPDTTATDDQRYAYKITLSNENATLSSISIPAWASLWNDGGTGIAGPHLISGTPSTTGSSIVRLEASLGGLSIYQNFTLVVGPPGTHDSLYDFFMPWMLQLSPVIQAITGTADTAQDFYDKLVAAGASPQAGVAYIIAHGYTSWNQTSFYALDYMWLYIMAAYPSAGLDSWAITAASFSTTTANCYSYMIVDLMHDTYAIIDDAQLLAIQQGLANLDYCILQLVTPPAPPTTLNLNVSPGLVMLVLTCSVFVGFAFWFYSMKVG